MVVEVAILVEMVVNRRLDGGEFLQGSVTATRRAEGSPEIGHFSDVTSQRPCIERSGPKVPIPLSG